MPRCWALGSQPGGRLWGGHGEASTPGALPALPRDSTSAPVELLLPVCLSTVSGSAQRSRSSAPLPPWQPGRLPAPSRGHVQAQTKCRLTTENTALESPQVQADDLLLLCQHAMQGDRPPASGHSCVTGKVGGLFPMLECQPHLPAGSGTHPPQPLSVRSEYRVLLGGWRGLGCSSDRLAAWASGLLTGGSWFPGTAVGQGEGTCHPVCRPR